MISSIRNGIETRTLQAIHDYIITKGFDKLIIDDIYALEKTSEVPFNKSVNWLVLNNRDSLLEFADLLGKFHYYAEGFFQPPGSRVNVRWGKLADKYKKMTLMVKNFNNELKSKECSNDFEEIYSTKAIDIISSADKVIEVLQSEDYLKALSNSMAKREICLNRISSSCAFRSDNKLLLIGTKYIGYNMAVEDIVKLIKRIPINEDKEILQREIISVYYDVRELDEYSMKILKALISYPYDLIKLIITYSKQLEDEKTCIKKLKQFYPSL